MPDNNGVTIGDTLTDSYQELADLPLVCVGSSTSPDTSPLSVQPMPADLAMWPLLADFASGWVGEVFPRVDANTHSEDPAGASADNSTFATAMWPLIVALKASSQASLGDATGFVVVFNLTEFGPEHPDGVNEFIVDPGASLAMFAGTKYNSSAWKLISFGTDLQVNATGSIGSTTVSGTANTAEGGRGSAAPLFPLQGLPSLGGPIRYALTEGQSFQCTMILLLGGPNHFLSVTPDSPRDYAHGYISLDSFGTIP